MTESWRRGGTESPIVFAIDPKGAMPPFEQLKAQVIAGIGGGGLIAGTRLPAVRQLATELGIAANTVARAYRELEADGFLETRGRNGTVVKGARDEATTLLQLAAQAYAARARELGLGSDEALEYVRVALATR